MHNLLQFVLLQTACVKRKGVPRYCRRRSLSFALALAALNVNCAHTPQAPALPLDTVEGLFEHGEQQRRAGLHPEALKTLNDVKTQYPYSRFAALAELRIADAHLDHGHYLEAIDAYRNFLKFHPTHAEAPEALSRIGAAYFAQIPRDWWFLPPSAEKEQEHVRQAIASYQDLLTRYDAGHLAEVARGHLADCRRKLAEHELYVARFYLKRGKFAAAGPRAAGLLANFAGLGYDAEALWIAAQAKLAVGDAAQAQAYIERLLHEFSHTPFARLARNRSKSLQLPARSSSFGT